MLCIMPTKLVVLCIDLFYGVTGFSGIILAHLMLNIPFAFYILNTAYEKVDATLFLLAADLGASSWCCYKDIIFPILRPTIISIALLLFLLHFSSFSIPLLLGRTIYHYTPEIMMYKMYSAGNGIYVYLFWIIRLFVIIPLFFAHNRYAIQKVKASNVIIPVKAGRYNPSAHGIWRLFCCGFIGLLIIGPFIAFIIKACDVMVFSFLVSVFSFAIDVTLGVAVCRVILNSLLLAVTSGAGAVFLGFIISSIELKAKNYVSRMIVGFATVITFFIGTIGIGIIFAWISYGKCVSSFIVGVLCHIVLNYVFAYRIIRSQMVLYHADMHKTAQAYGATYNKALYSIAFPFVLPALLRAFCISFGLSLTEVGAGTILQGNIGLTIPMAIRMYRAAGNQEEVIGLSIILLFLVFTVDYALHIKRRPLK